MRRPSPTYNLAVCKPDVAGEWHPDRNGDLRPEDVTPGSGKQVWWRCRADPTHEWEAQVAHRTGPRRTGCPDCAASWSGRSKATATHNLAVVYPDTARDWHGTRNGPLTPEQVAPHSGRTVWWQCPAYPDHEWEAKVNDRTRGKGRGTGCPICAGLMVLAGFNDLVTRRPDLAAQWHPAKNGTLTAQQVTAGTQRLVWWLCPCGYEWQARVLSRTSEERVGCPACTGRAVWVGHTDLGTRRSDIAAGWDPHGNGSLTPADVTEFSSQQVWWQCLTDARHPAWQARVADRTSAGSSCPACSGRVILAGVNDLATERPDVATRWHPRKNGRLTPAQVRPGSEQRVWWLCPRGHEWQATVNSRTRPGGIGCPECRLTAVSKREIGLFAELRSLLGPDVKQAVRRENDRGTAFTFDMAVPAVAGAVLVEYDGGFWHADTEQPDMYKTLLGEQSGARVLRVREDGLPRLPEVWTVTVPAVSSVHALTVLVLAALAPVLSAQHQAAAAAYAERGLADGTDLAARLINEAERTRSVSKRPGRHPMAQPQPGHSAADRYPALVAQWDPANPRPLSDYRPASKVVAVWRCARGHRWITAIGNRTRWHTSGPAAFPCPSCSTRGHPPRYPLPPADPALGPPVMTEEYQDALNLLAQGYAVAHVESVTGVPAAVLDLVERAPVTVPVRLPAAG